MTINVSAPPVENEQEALTLMFYHLQLAAMYFEATPEMISYTDVPDTFTTAPMWQWLQSMDALYAEEDK